MGQQQLLLIILGVIIVGVSIQVGVSMFSSQSIKSNQDAITLDLVNLASDAFQYKLRPSMMGGGSGTYSNYIINLNGPWGVNNPNATYEILSENSTTFSLRGTSKQVNGAIIEMIFDGNGKVISGPNVTGF